MEVFNVKDDLAVGLKKSTNANEALTNELNRWKLKVNELEHQHMEVRHNEEAMKELAVLREELGNQKDCMLEAHAKSHETIQSLQVDIKDARQTITELESDLTKAKRDKVRISRQLDHMLKRYKETVDPSDGNN